METTTQRTRRHHTRAGLSWTVWAKAGGRRFRFHTVDISARGAKLKPRGELLPGSAVQLQFHSAEGRPVQVSAVVWRVDSDGLVVLFLGGIPHQFTDEKRWSEASEVDAQPGGRAK